jgi:hypothetical protein
MVNRPTNLSAFAVPRPSGSLERTASGPLTFENPPGTIQMVPRSFCTSSTCTDWNSVEQAPLLMASCPLPLKLSLHFFWNSQTFQSLSLWSKASISHAS